MLFKIFKLFLHPLGTDEKQRRRWFWECNEEGDVGIGDMLDKLK
jgi:hypothetical protein